MSKMAERGAEAMADAADIDSETMYADMFRAAIKAMREPTEEMVNAVGSDWGPQLEDNWRKMIDEALK